MSEPQRKRLLGIVHVAKKQLGLDDDLYRDILESLTAQRSAKALTLAELERVLEHFKAKGFRVVATDKKLSPASAHKVIKEPKDKIRALWISLFNTGKIEDGSETALNHFCENFVNVSNVGWLLPKQSAQVIEALKAMGERGDASG